VIHTVLYRDHRGTVLLVLLVLLLTLSYNLRLEKLPKVRYDGVQAVLDGGGAAF